MSGTPIFLLFLAISQDQAGPPVAAGPEQKVLALIDGSPVTAAEVQREVQLATRSQEVAGEELAHLQNRALAQIIDRRLVLRRLTATKEAASQQDVDLSLARLTRQLEAKETKLSDHLKTIGMSEAELREDLLWKLSWSRYIQTHVTPANLQKFFEKHRRDFDGTEMVVSQILLKAERADKSATDEAVKKATAIREEIVSGKKSFAEAAKEYSHSPSAKDGGKIGAIRRHEPMTEEFSHAAFALQKGEISQPILTAHGVHLIQVLDVIPGKVTWQECTDSLRPAVTLYLFRWLADQERKTAQITYK